MRIPTLSQPFLAIAVSLLFSSCASTGSIMRKYDAAMQAAQNEAENLMVDELEGSEWQEMESQAFKDEWLRSNYGLTWASQPEWSQKQYKEIEFAYVLEFVSRLRNRYPQMDGPAVHEACQQAGQACNMKYMEDLARTSHNSAIEEFLQAKLQNLVKARDAEVQADRGKIERFWQAVLVGFSSIVESNQNVRPHRSTWQPANSYQARQPNRAIGSLSANAYGAGNSYHPDSINNPYGRYGNPYSNTSATNPYATNAPMLFDRQGNYRGRLSANPYHPDSTSNPYGRFGSPYSATSINNPYGAGNPYAADSPTNPYGRGWVIIGQKIAAWVKWPQL